MDYALDVLWRFLLLFRSLWKYLLHAVTQKSELERLCSYDHTPEVTAKVEYSLVRSKALGELKLQLFAPEHDTFELARSIAQVKRFSADKSVTLLGACIADMRRANDRARMLEEKIMSSRYDPGDAEQQQALSQLWSMLLPDVRRSQDIISSEWKEIGFTSEDPAKDLSLSGPITITNLLQFLQHHPRRATQIFHESRSPRIYFPFMAAGTAVTSWLFSLLQHGKLNLFFYDEHQEVMEAFHTIFAFIYVEFHRFVKQSKPDTVLQYKDVQQRFERQLSKDFDVAIGRKEWGWSAADAPVKSLKRWIDGTLIE